MSYPYIQEEEEKAFFKSEQRLITIIERVLSGSDYDGGELEHARDQANNASSMLARLLLMLYQTKTLTEQQLKVIIDPSSIGYHKGWERWPSKQTVKQRFELGKDSDRDSM